MVGLGREVFLEGAESPLSERAIASEEVELLSLLQGSERAKELTIAFPFFERASASERVEQAEEVDSCLSF